jgi:hypothetical protein
MEKLFQLAKEELDAWLNARFQPLYEQVANRKRLAASSAKGVEQPAPKRIKEEEEEEEEIKVTRDERKSKEPIFSSERELHQRIKEKEERIEHYKAQLGKSIPKYKPPPQKRPPSTLKDVKERSKEDRRIQYEYLSKYAEWLSRYSFVLHDEVKKKKKKI